MRPQRALSSKPRLPLMEKTRPQAISLFADGFAIQYRQDIIDFGLRQRIPVVSGWPIFAKSGALFTYGPQLTSSYARLAYYAGPYPQGYLSLANS